MGDELGRQSLTTGVWHGRYLWDRMRMPSLGVYLRVWVNERIGGGLLCSKVQDTDWSSWRIGSRWRQSGSCGPPQMLWIKWKADFSSVN